MLIDTLREELREIITKHFPTLKRIKIAFHIHDDRAVIQIDAQPEFHITVDGTTDTTAWYHFSGDVEDGGKE